MPRFRKSLEFAERYGVPEVQFASGRIDPRYSRIFLPDFSFSSARGFWTTSSTPLVRSSDADMDAF